MNSSLKITVLQKVTVTIPLKVTISIKNNSFTNVQFYQK